MKKYRSTDQVVYIGDNFGVECATGTVFIGGIPKTMEKHMEAVPLLEHLFVPVEDIVKARAELATEGSLLYVANNAVKTYLREGRRK
ncbi:hypothetical protein [Peptoniphilus sp. EMRHCC_23]|uniref:hypothetical protein n=1 Tax=Peptoniphilus rachelemmaiella TaxID=2811779 RepID=UPI001C0062F3|nr:hypothetical protein [Peptoniphilus rachelemmaiella]